MNDINDHMDAATRVRRGRALLVWTLVILGGLFLVQRALDDQADRRDEGRDKWVCILSGNCD